MTCYNNLMISKSYYCSNCGKYGHSHSQCNHPITSYGIICFKVINNKLHYILVQRKDSLNYIEFLRGKYEINDKFYIFKLLSNMTYEERKKLLTIEFHELWKSLWQSDKYKRAQQEYNRAKAKFDTLKKGFILKCETECIFLDLKYAIENTTCNLIEPEWGFPKGRRNINEEDYVCALREFKEETSLKTEHIRILDIAPYEETFSGTNSVRYKHVYYIAMFNDMKCDVEFKTCREIRKVKWCSYEEAQNKIRDINVERKALFKRIDGYILKMLDLRKEI